MSSRQQSSILGREQSEDQLLENALSALAKALKAQTFYPEGHPQRGDTTTSAFNQLQPLLEEGGLILLWSRDACTVADRPALKSSSLTAKGLAREMLVRKLQRLTFSPEVTIRDLMRLLTILTTDASIILAHGGVEKEMAAAGIVTICANEVDLETLKKLAEQQEEPEAEDGEDLQPEEEGEEKGSENQGAELQEAMELETLLKKLKKETEEPAYLQLIRGIIDAVEKLKRREALHPLTAALSTLMEEHDLPRLSEQQREYVRFALEKTVEGEMTFFLLDLAQKKGTIHDNLLKELCTVVGKTMAYPLIQRLCIADSLQERKSIAGLLTRTGESGIPALLSMLKDERWYVVRNMVTILGEIASPSALRSLQTTAAHAEPKVRKEVIKSLLKISPQGAENTFVSMTSDPDDDVVRLAIHSLGSMRSKSAVRPLLEIVNESDPFLKELPLKKQAILAIGRIGEKQATESLTRLLECRGWLSPRRWQELKIAAANALGQIGDESAIPLLRRLAQQKTPLGSACGDAVDNLERLAK